MKKVTFFILTIFTVATLFAAARPSLDGRAVVAESGTMPRGLFARTVGYLPGDSVSVTNPATGSTIDVLVLGAIDPSEGVAILLSPEAAEGLRIKPDSNVQVKLTKRTGSLDENANGSAVISEGDDETVSADASRNEIADNTVVPQDNYDSYNDYSNYGANDNEPDYEEYAVSPERTPVSEIAEKAVEQPVVPTPVVKKQTDEPAETLYEEVPPLPGDEDKKELEPVAEIPAEYAESEDENLQKVVLIEVEGEEAVSPDEEFVPADGGIEIVSDEIVENEIVREEIAAEKIVPAEESVISESDDLQQVIIVPVENQAVRSEPLPPVIEELPVDYEYADVEGEEYVAEELPYEIETEPEVEVAYEDEGFYSEEEIDAYQPIILVPTDENPPVAEETENPDVTVETLPASEEMFDEVVEVLPPPASENPVVSNEWTNYIVPSLKNLRSGSYYVQIASLGNGENIKSIVDKYSTKYPIVLVQNSAKTAYQVMVGPLNIDEYGSVSEKFQSYGYKDSFVRKIR